MEREFDIVQELPPFPGRRGTKDGVWHVAKKRGRSIDFAPIRCSKDEGIVMPGGTYRGLPTCPDCRRIVDPSGDLWEPENKEGEGG